MLKWKRMQLSYLVISDIWITKPETLFQFPPLTAIRTQRTDRDLEKKVNREKRKN